MELHVFMEKRQLSTDGKYYFVKEDSKMFVQPINNSKPFRLPKELETFKDIAIWEVGPNGKTLHLNNLKVK